MITAEDVALVRSGRRVLGEISFCVRLGELVALIGPNGAGKSTLLRLLAGLARPTRGRVLVEGEALDRLPPNVRARRIGWLPQGARAAWGITVRELVALGRMPHGDRAQAPVDRAIARLGLASLAGARIDQLSGGEVKRAMIARVLAGEPRVLLLDEPTADLDPAVGFAVMQLLRAVATEEKRAVVVVLHDLPLAGRFADRFVLLAKGQLVAEGDAARILNDATAGRVFGIGFGADDVVLPA